MCAALEYLACAPCHGIHAADHNARWALPQSISMHADLEYQHMYRVAPRAKDAQDMFRVA